MSRLIIRAFDADTGEMLFEGTPSGPGSEFVIITREADRPARLQADVSDLSASIEQG